MVKRRERFLVAQITERLVFIEIFSVENFWDFNSRNSIIFVSIIFVERGMRGSIVDFQERHKIYERRGIILGGTVHGPYIYGGRAVSPSIYGCSAFT